MDWFRSEYTALVSRVVNILCVVSADSSFITNEAREAASDFLKTEKNLTDDQRYLIAEGAQLIADVINKPVKMEDQKYRGHIISGCRIIEVATEAKGEC